FLPLMGVLCLLMAFGPLANWKRTTIAHMVKSLWRPWVISMVIGLVVPWFYSDDYSWLAALSVFIGSWIFTALIADVWHKLRNSNNYVSGLKKLSLSYHGMLIAHAGIAVTMLGVSLTSIYNEQRDVRMAVNEPLVVEDFVFVLQEVRKVNG